MGKYWYQAITVGALCLLAQGCTYRDWFDVFQNAQRQDCYSHANQQISNTQDCLDRVNRQTYEQYQRSREEAIKHPGQDEPQPQNLPLPREDGGDQPGKAVGSPAPQ